MVRHAEKFVLQLLPGPEFDTAGKPFSNGFQRFLQVRASAHSRGAFDSERLFRESSKLLLQRASHCSFNRSLTSQILLHACFYIVLVNGQHKTYLFFLKLLAIKGIHFISTELDLPIE